MAMYSQSETEHVMKVQEVILRATSGRISWADAADILGISYRSMMRWKSDYHTHGYDGLFDRRNQTPSPKRVPFEQVEFVLKLFKEKYFDFNVKHFHEKLLSDYGIQLSYPWVKKALQTAGYIPIYKRGKKHRMRRERRPLRGMLLHLDASKHAWITGSQTQWDLIVIMDDATNEVYYAEFVPEESTASCMKALRFVIETQGLFCALYTDQASHFAYTPKAGEPPDRSKKTQIQRALEELSIEHILAFSPQARGRSERLFGTWQGRLPQELRHRGIRTIELANQFLKEHFIPWHNQNLTVPARDKGSAFVPYQGNQLDRIFSIQHQRVAAPDNTISFGKFTLQIKPSSLRISFAKCSVKVYEHLDGTISVGYGPHSIGRFDAQGRPLTEKKGPLQSNGKIIRARFAYKARSQSKTYETINQN